MIDHLKIPEPMPTRDGTSASLHGADMTVVVGHPEANRTHTPVTTSPDAAADFGPVARVETARGRAAVSIHDADLDDVVTLHNGASLTLRSAIEAGFIARADLPEHLQGRAPADARRSTEDHTQAPEAEVDPEMRGELLSDEDEDRFNAVLDGTQGIERVRAMQEVSETGEITTETLAALASSKGVEPGALGEQIAPVRQALQTQATTAIKETVPDGLYADFVKWAGEEGQIERRTKAVFDQLGYGRLAGYRALASDYMAGLAERNPQAVLNTLPAGDITAARQRPDGKIVVTTTEGMELEWVSAVKAGLIKFGRPRR